MALQPISVTLTDGQKLEVLKRFRQRYGEELEKVENDILAILTAQAECAFVASYIGEQAEVVELKQRDDELAGLEARRAHLGKIIERLDSVLPGRGDPAKSGGFQRY